MKPTKLILLLCICHLSLYTFHSYAAVPREISYQGRLTDSTGKPLAEGKLTVTFTLYTSATSTRGEDIVWTSNDDGIPDTISISKGGLFSTTIGPFPEKVKFDQPYWLGIQIIDETGKADKEMSPRQRLTSAGYAVRAEKAEQADNADTVSNVGVSATPTPNKLLPLDANGQLPGSQGLLGNNIIVLSGIISDGATIPLPAGYTESQCRWIVSYANTTQAQFPAMDGWSWVKCYVTGRVVTAKCGGTGPGQGTYPSDANYIIIGIK